MTEGRKYIPFLLSEHRLLLLDGGDVLDAGAIESVSMEVVDAFGDDVSLKDLFEVLLLDLDVQGVEDSTVSMRDPIGILHDTIHGQTSRLGVVVLHEVVDAVAGHLLEALEEGKGGVLAEADHLLLEDRKK